MESESPNGEAGPETQVSSEATAAAAPEAPVDPLEQARQEAARFKDQLLRTAADFDNFRKRSRREQAEGEKKAREDLLRFFFPVFYNLVRALAHP